MQSILVWQVSVSPAQLDDARGVFFFDVDRQSIVDAVDLGGPVWPNTVHRAAGEYIRRFKLSEERLADAFDRMYPDYLLMWRISRNYGARNFHSTRLFGKPT